MHPSAMQNCQQFFDCYGSAIDAHANVRVIEIGAQDVNGSLRITCPPHFEYVGVDFVAAKGVDVVLTDPYSLPFGDESADVVMSSSKAWQVLGRQCVSPTVRDDRGHSHYAVCRRWDIGPPMQDLSGLKGRRGRCKGAGVVSRVWVTVAPVACVTRRRTALQIPRCSGAAHGARPERKGRCVLRAAALEEKPGRLDGGPATSAYLPAGTLPSTPLT